MSLLHYIKPNPDIRGTLQNLVVKHQNDLWDVGTGSADRIDEYNDDIDVQHLIGILAEAPG
jgi:hypothetical protein